jgi:hypothetical protein
MFLSLRRCFYLSANVFISLQMFLSLRQLFLSLCRLILSLRQRFHVFDHGRYACDHGLRVYEGKIRSEAEVQTVVKVT